jgi:predicted GNAT family acetyltransferase
MSLSFRFVTDVRETDWTALKNALVSDQFDNGRTPEEYRRSAEGSHLNVVVYDDHRIIGNGRILSDGVCNAYIVDVWTRSDYRRQGIATEIVRLLTDSVPGQHIYLQTDDALGLYEKSGFRPQPHGMGCVVGSWLGR